MNLSRIKVNGTRLLTATGISLPSELTPQHYQNIQGIKLNGNPVIDFRSYNKCGPGPVTTAEATNGCNLLITSDRMSRSDMNCDEGVVSYIPYRGIAGIMRAGAFAGNEYDGRAIAVNCDFDTDTMLDGFTSLQETGTFGYPWGLASSSSLNYPGIITEPNDGPTPEEYMAKLLYPSAYVGGDSHFPSAWTGPARLAISNFYSKSNVDAGNFSLGIYGGYNGELPEPPSDYSPELGYTPVLFDQDHLVAGSWGVTNWGTLGNDASYSYDDSLKIATYDEEFLWYAAGCNFYKANYSRTGADYIDKIVFIGCTYNQVGAFLTGWKEYSSYGDGGPIDIDGLIEQGKVYSTGFIDRNDNVNDFKMAFQAIGANLGWSTSGNPNTWVLSNKTAIITGFGYTTTYGSINSEAASIFNNSLGTDHLFSELLWHAIANTPGCIGCLVSDFPGLFRYSYMGFNGTYNLLGPISPWLDPFGTILLQPGAAADWSTRLIEFCGDPTELFNYMRDPDSASLFPSYKGIMNAATPALQIYMQPSGLNDEVKILSEPVYDIGSWSSIGGDTYASNDYTVDFSQRTLSFNINMDGIIIPQ